MKKVLTPSKTLVVPLLGWWACALAQSLGAPAGQAWIGLPLDVTVPARFASADSGDPCVQAEVAYGDTVLRGRQVRTTVTGAGAERRVRIRSDVRIDEPLVTVTLRSGCGNVVSRSYTLLPDMPPEAVLAAMAAPAAVAGAAAASVASTARAMPLPPAGRSAELVATPLRTLRAAPRLIAARGRAQLAAAPMHASRLHVEPLAMPANAILRSSLLLSEPADGARRAAAAMLWRAINADPQEVLHSTASLQRLERELAQLRVAAGQTRNEMAALRRSLDDARPWYASTATVQLLALLVLATAAASAALAWRSRRAAQAPLFDLPAVVPEAPHEAAFEPHTVEEVATPRPVERRGAPLGVPVAPLRPVRLEPLAPAAAPVMPAVAVAPLALEPAERPAAPRGGLLRVETLAATFEEVEFLVSLGLETDAMDVLKAYIEASGSPAPLAFFELMRLCARDDPATVDAVRRRYQHVFGLEAPRLEHVNALRGLESHQDLGARITRVWGTSDSLSVIERALFDLQPAASALTLQAGRDLLGLYDLALALVTESDPDAVDAHPLAPWAHADDVHEAAAAAQAAADATGGHHFALDVDLGAAPEALPESLADREDIAARLKAEKDAARQAQARKLAEDEEAFSAAVASERVPLGRH